MFYFIYRCVNMFSDPLNNPYFPIPLKFQQILIGD
jgi:hypothetical protein